MFGALLSGGLGLLRQLAPTAISWGMKKLATTNFGKTVLNENTLGQIVGGINKFKTHKREVEAQERPAYIQQNPQDREIDQEHENMRQNIQRGMIKNRGIKKARRNRR